MAPAVVFLDTSSDFDPAPSSSKASAAPPTQRSLLLAPPSLASHESRLRDILASYDRSVTDLQMLDRLSAGLVNLPESTYHLVLILTDADGSRVESTKLLNRTVLGLVSESLKAGGCLRAQDGGSLVNNGLVAKEATLAGLVAGSAGEFSKPDYGDGEVVSLKFGLKKKQQNGVAVQSVKVNTAPAVTRPAGVGFVDFSDDFGEIIEEDDDDDDLINEDTLLTEDDLRRPLNIPPECAPKAGKRRRACKDCTCGLAARIEAEDAAKRAAADAKLQSIKLATDDLAEVDFTVQGKVGSCGNCALGDAFRCDGCPYIGLPPFKPGEEVRLLNNVVQL